MRLSFEWQPDTGDGLIVRLPWRMAFSIWWPLRWGFVFGIQQGEPDFLEWHLACFEGEIWRDEPDYDCRGFLKEKKL